jgi:hypothetical protein
VEFLRKGLCSRCRLFQSGPRSVSSFRLDKLDNQYFAKAVEVFAYGLILVLLYMLVYTFFWFHPAIKVKLIRQGSSPSRPETSFVFRLDERQQPQQVDIKITLQCHPTWFMRKVAARVSANNLGILLSWRPAGLLQCRSNSATDGPYYVVSDTALVLHPIERMNLADQFVEIDYSFRFTMGAQPVVQRAHLRPRHMNRRS